MISRRLVTCFVLVLVLATVVSAQSLGGIRGTVNDQDFEVPLYNAQVLIVELGTKVTTTEEGNFVFGEVAPGTYTLVFSKVGYTRQYRPNIVVAAGRMTDVEISLPGEFTDMEEFVVQDLELGGSSELGLLNLRMESPALMDSVSADLMSQAGASDASEALKLVSGASVQDGKYAVVRGLPDRYVNSQLNGVRLPTADADKRAVELDQFPSAVVESIQVSKTFTPDQQGDASGGAVNVVTKGVPEQTTFSISGQLGYHSQAAGRGDFMTYEGGGVNFLGMDDGRRDIQYQNLGGGWDGAVGVSQDKAPVDYKMSISGGGRHAFNNGITFGGFGSLFYERDSSFFDDGINDRYWVGNPGDPLTPQLTGASNDNDRLSSLYDVTQGSQEVKWGGLGTVGMETENNQLTLLYMSTHVAEDVATLAEDTRGKAYSFPGYNPNDPYDPGNSSNNHFMTPYLRTETLEYTERSTQTLQFSGTHTLAAVPEFGWDNFLFKSPVLGWTVAASAAGMKQPDKRQFGSMWYADSYDLGVPPYVPPGVSPAYHTEYKPEANYTMGNLQRIWKEITEDSLQGRAGATLPFTQWNEQEGYVKLGLFDDQVTREYKQESFSNFNDNGNHYPGDWGSLWSGVFPGENHPITAGDTDVDYDGEQRITAGYGTVDLPFNEKVNLIGGARWERTELDIMNHPESGAQWVPPSTGVLTQLKPGDADVSFQQNDLLPSLGVVYAPWQSVTFRGTYSETVARQTFKELTPIQQMEFLGGDVFIGNPELEMSALKNYDLRADYAPYAGSLVSVSYFYKDIDAPIEYVQRFADNVGVYTTPVNYLKGRLNGWEFEVRQQLGRFWEAVEGLSLGANVTLIDSEVTLPADEQAKLAAKGVSISSRDMTEAPSRLYNLFLTHTIEKWGTKWGLFYTVKGDTLVAGAGQANGRYVPSVYAKEYGTLNFSVTQQLKENWKVKFQAKNLTNPKIQEVYKYDGGDQVKTSYTRGLKFSLSMAYSF